jgi:general secretion pathway protein N
MRALPALLLGIAAYGAFLVATVPASLVTDRVARASGGRVTFEKVDGSLWHGRSRIRAATAAGALAIDELEWRFLPARLAMGEAAFALRVRQPGLEAMAVAARSVGETRLRDVRASGKAAAFVPLLPLAAAWQPDGTVAIESDAFAYDGREARGSARIEWQDAALSLANARPLGSWRADLAGKGPGAEVTLVTVKGPLRLAGKGTLTADGRLAFTGEARADPGREKDLEALLALIGPRRPDGAHAISVR